MKAARMMLRLANRSRAMGLAAAGMSALALHAADARAESMVVAHHSPTALHALAAHDHWKQPQAPVLPVRADLRQLYRVDSVIGRGGFGVVHEGRDRQSNAPVAIKRVCKQTTSKAKFLQEVEILRALGGQHNVVGLCEAFETADAYVLVTELVDGEELFDHLITNGVFSECRAQRLVADIAHTLTYLHAHRVVHGDLKPENILVSADASAMRLIDFGQSFREHISSERKRCVDSTVAYAAPEVLRASGTASRTTAAGSAVDMWGLGVVLYILVCGFHPFDPENDLSDEELAARIMRGAFDKTAAEWTELAPAARDLIERLLEMEPSRRLTAEEVLTHEWVASASTNA